MNPQCSEGNRVPTDSNGGDENKTELQNPESGSDADDTTTPTQPSWSTGRPGFAINKYGITRAVVHFRKRPHPAPLTLCLDHPGTALSHKHLLNLIKTALVKVPDAQVTSITFIDRNVFLGARELENRWLVTVNSKQARDELLRTNIVLYEKKTQFRKYDDIVAVEFEQFLRYKQMKKEMFPGVSDDVID